MAGDRYVTPYDQYMDTNGLPIVGGQLSFFASGTGTHLATYNDNGLTVPNPNPIILDSAGNPGSVFLQNGLAYRVKLQDVDGNTIFDMDPVVSFAPST